MSFDGRLLACYKVQAVEHVCLEGIRQKSLAEDSSQAKDTQMVIVNFGSLAIMSLLAWTGYCFRSAAQDVDPWLCVPGFHRVCLCRFPIELYYHKGPKYVLSISFQEPPTSEASSHTPYRTPWRRPPLRSICRHGATRRLWDCAAQVSAAEGIITSRSVLPACPVKGDRGPGR
jgi:hypothetical protein